MFCNIFEQYAFPQTTVNTDCLRLSNFRIYPAAFYLSTDETFLLTILFSAMEAKRYLEEVVLVCDNCQVKPIKIQGNFKLNYFLVSI